MGKAIEEGQNQWLKESERLAAGLREIQKHAGGALEAESRQLERRLEEGAEDMRRRIEEISGVTNTLRTALHACELRISEQGSSLSADLKESEERLRRQLQ